MTEFSFSEIKKWIDNAISIDDFTYDIKSSQNDNSSTGIVSCSGLDVAKLLNNLHSEATTLFHNGNPDSLALYEHTIYTILKSAKYYSRKLHSSICFNLNNAFDLPSGLQSCSKKSTKTPIHDDSLISKVNRPFWYSSFIKLNNICYIKSQVNLILERLKHLGNIFHHTKIYSILSWPNESTFPLNLEIIELENIFKRSDSGFNQYFITLCDESGKLLAKTKNVKFISSLHFYEKVLIHVKLPLALLFTVYEIKALQKPKGIGRAVLILNINNLLSNCCMKWISLDTQGILLIRISYRLDQFSNFNNIVCQLVNTLKNTQDKTIFGISEKLQSVTNEVISLKNLYVYNPQEDKLKNARSRKSQSVQSINCHKTTIFYKYYCCLNETFATMKIILRSDILLMLLTSVWSETQNAFMNLLLQLSGNFHLRTSVISGKLKTTNFWLCSLLDLYHAFDDESKKSLGVPHALLNTCRYQEVKLLLSTLDKNESIFINGNPFKLFNSKMPSIQSHESSITSRGTHIANTCLQCKNIHSLPAIKSHDYELEEDAISSNPPLQERLLSPTTFPDPKASNYFLELSLTRSAAAYSCTIIACRSRMNC